jgi:hypothetical protein
MGVIADTLITIENLDKSGILFLEEKGSKLGLCQSIHSQPTLRKILLSTNPFYK